MTTLRNFWDLLNELKYETLKKECEEKILKDLNESKLHDVFVFALKYKSEKLKQESFKYIKAMISAPEDVSKLIITKCLLDELMEAAKNFRISL